MALGSKFNTIAAANTIGQLRTDHNLIVSEVNLLSNTTGINHGTLSILSVKGTANVSANAVFSGQNTAVTGTFTVGGSRIATNTQLQSALSNTNLAIADRMQVANADTRFFQTDTTSETVTSNTTFSGANTNISGTLLVSGISKFVANTDMDDNEVSQAELKDYSITLTASGNTGATQTLDLTNGNAFSATVNAACTFTFSNPPITGKLGEFVLVLTNGGSSAITWPASVDWPSATAPTLTAAGVDVLTFLTQDAGTTWLGFTSGLDLS